MVVEVYLDIHIGDKEIYQTEEVSYKHTSTLLSKHAASCGLSSTATPQDLSEDQREILKSVTVHTIPPSHYLSSYIVTMITPDLVSAG